MSVFVYSYSVIPYNAIRPRLQRPRLAQSDKNEVITDILY